MSSTTNIPAVHVTGLISQTLRVLEGLEDVSVLLDSLAEIDLVDPCDEGQPSHMTSRPHDLTYSHLQEMIGRCAFPYRNLLTLILYILKP